jgi:hypothetical protein
MSYVPSTDFVGLWRAQISGGVKKGEMPGLDFVVAALARSGIINIVISGTAPTSNQSTTAWFRPASPSAMAEGFMYLWDGSAYVLATPALFSNAVAASSTLLAPLASPVFTGDPKAPTPSPGDNDTSIATTAFVAASYAPLASPVFTGDPKAPTPTVGDNDTSIATTAFVQASIIGSVAGVALVGNRGGVITLNGGNLLTNELATPRYDVAQTLTVPQQVQARANIRAAVAGAQVTDYSSNAWEWGVFWSDASATNVPISGHRFTGTAQGIDANNLVIVAYDIDYNPTILTWTNTPTFYNVGDKVRDNVDSSLWQCVLAGIYGNAAFSVVRANSFGSWASITATGMAFSRIKKAGAWSNWIAL